MRKRFLTLVTLFACFAFLCGIWGLSVQFADAKEKTRNNSSISGKGAPRVLKPVVTRSLRNGTSIPLRDMKRFTPVMKRQPHPPLLMPKAQAATGPQTPDGALSQAPVGGGMPAPFLTFEGGSDDENESTIGIRYVPPDTNGDVGPNHYIQYINAIYSIWDKSGNRLVGPLPGNAFWQGLGGDCETHNDGDPIVLYDPLADRWMVSQFALFGSDGGHHQCIAISQTSDPTGAWHQYDFLYSMTLINDYPHFGVWPDAYYMTANQFTEGFSWAGQGVMAFERSQMLLGLPAQQIYFDLFGVNQNFGGALPSDLDGPAPPAGAPNIYLEVDDESVFGTDRLSLWEFHVDWVTPGNSTFGIGGNPNLTLNTDPFVWGLCGFSRSCIPQPAPGEGLDAISDRLMYRIQYRNFGGYSTLVTNHTVDAGSGRAGVRWYELRDDGSGWAIFQQGTWAPADGEHRWMGSAAMDSAGNIAVGYSLSSSSTMPAVRYAGRLASDPLGDLSQGENTIINGTGVQFGSANRWGDYSGIVVDPSPGTTGGIDCDFWYTNEYYQNTGSFDFNTKVGGFTFAPGACGGPSGVLNGTVTDSVTTNPIAGAQVQVQPGGFTTTTDVNGFYQFNLAVGTYDVTASAYGYFSQTANGVLVTDGGVTTQDFALDPAPVVTVSGNVFDNSGHGWPLYARIDITGYPGGPVFTDPVTGDYSVDLVEAQPYTFNVSAIAPGYNPETRPVTPPPGGSTEDFGLTIDGGLCIAPGYDFAPPGSVFFDDFESGFGNWTMDGLWNPENESDTCGSIVAPFPSPTNDAYYGIDGTCTFNNGSANTGSLTMIAPVSVPSTGSATLSFYSYEQTECGGASCPYDGRFVEVSTDGGTSWTLVGEGDTENVWYQPSFSLAPYSGQDVLVRFRFDTLDSVLNDFFGWMVDSVDISVAQCVAVPGGLLVGNVYDANTGLGLNGAAVTSDEEPSDTTTSFSTPDDPAIDEGFYILFSSLTGLHDFTATKALYGPDTETVDVVADAIVVQNFNLGTGHLVATPSEFDVTVDFGQQLTQQLTITNDGNADATFEIQEFNGLASLQLHPKLPAAVAKKVQKERKGSLGPASVRSSSGKSKKSKAALFPPSTPQAWIGTSQVPGGIIRYAHAQCDDAPDSFYVISGVDSTFSLTANTWRYDATTDTWNPLASIPSASEAPTAVCFEGRIYVAVGAFTSNEFLIYDIASDTWLTGAALPRFVEGGAMGALDGTIYLIGGDDNFQPADGVSGQVDVYDIATDTWTGTGASMPIASGNAGFVQSGENVYVVGGWGNSAPGSNVNATQRYNMTTDTWETGPDFTSQRSDFALSASSEALYSMGGDQNGGGFFEATNTAERLDISGWPGGAWADLGDPLPAARMANNAGFCTTVISGGEVWTTGALTSGFSVDGTNEYRTTGEGCGGGVDVPWLSENPVTATVPAGGQVIVDVTFDASQVPQPGDYFAHMKITTDTPYPAQNVNVTMHVPLPPNFGTLNGNVSGLGRCDTAGGPIEGATVFVDGPLADYTLTTDANGNYQWSFDAANSPVDLTVSAPGYLGETRTGVVIVAGQTTTEDFTLRKDAPCASATPTFFDVTLDANQQTTLPLTLMNDGGGALNFNIFESEFLLTLPQGKTLTVPKVLLKSVTKRSKTASPKGAPVQRIQGYFSPAMNAGFDRSGRAKAAKKDNRNGAPVSPNDPPWTAIANYPAPVMDNTCAEIAGKVYCVGDLGASNALRIYDVATDTWSSGAQKLNARQKPAVAAINGQLYVVGGWDSGGTPVTALESYDPGTDTWTAHAPVPTAGASSPGVNLANKFVVVGGCIDNACNVGNDVYSYDPGTDTWTQLADYPTGISWNACAAISGQMYCTGGYDGIGESASTYSYNPGTDSWTQVANLPQTQWAMGYIASDNLFYISGGVTDNFATVTNEGFSYDPGANTWTAIANSNNTRYRGGSACGFYRFGGSSGGFTPTPESEVYPGLTNCGGFTDVPWLSESPTSGTVPPDSSLIVDVTFDSTGLAPGDYTATLVIATNDPGASQISIPVTLHVLPGVACSVYQTGFDGPFDWELIKLACSNISSNLECDPVARKAWANVPTATPTCDTCDVTTSMLNTSNDDDSKMWLYTNQIDKRNRIEIKFKIEKDKVILLDKFAGTRRGKVKADVVLDPNVFYLVETTYDGATYTVSINGVPVISYAITGLQAGDQGMAARGANTVVRASDFCVN